MTEPTLTWPEAPVPTGPHIECFEPATRAPLGCVPVDSPEDVRTTVARAHEAQRAYAKSTFKQRRAVLRHILDHLLTHADELCDVIVRDAGKTHENAILGEIWPVCEKLRWTMANGEGHLTPEVVGSGLFMHKRASIHFPPRGVVGVICPWNYPLQNILGPTIPALFAGNGVVIKVSEQVAWSSARVQRIFDEALEANGWSKDLVRIVNGFGETGKALVSSGVDLVVFTGSGPNGRRVIEESAKTLTPVILELGGKDPLIVCDDASLEQAAHVALSGCYIAAGQNCLASERVIVVDGIYDAFVARVVALASELRQGRPQNVGAIDVGAIVSAAQVDIIERLVGDAIAKGARALVGGERAHTELGQYFEPTVLVDVTPEMAIMQEETFGPVMTIARVSSVEEAIELANSTEFGLGSTIMTQNRKRARQIADRLVAGSASVNDFGLTYMAQDLPFGGVRGSGFGRLNGRDGLRACTNPKAVLEDRLPLAMPMKIYPVRPGDYGLARGVIRAMYRPALSGRLAGVIEIGRAVAARFGARA